MGGEVRCSGSKRDVGVGDHCGIFPAIGLVSCELALLAVPLRFTQELDLVGINERHVLFVAGLLVIPRLGPLPAFEEDPTMITDSDVPF